MKRIEDIKEFEDIDTYYNISSLVEEIFQDRVEAHKHLVSANKEIERLNNIINELEKSWKEEITKLTNFIQEDVSLIEINNIRQMLIQERQKDLYKLQELKGSNSNENL